MQGAIGGMRSWDLVSLASVLRAFRMDLVLLDEGGPKVDLRSTRLEDALVCTVETGARFRGRFELPRGWGLFGFVHSPGLNDSWCHGIGLVAGTALWLGPGGVSEFFLDEGARLTLVLVPAARMDRALASAGRSGDAEGLQAPGPLLCRSQPEARRLCGLYWRLRASMLGGQGPRGMGVDELLQAHMDWMGAGEAASRPPFPRGRRGYYLLAQRAEAYMRAHMREDVSIEDVCRACQVSERNLRYAFEQMMRVSPKRYLSMLRLCAACQSLLTAASGRRSVRAVALACGMWDLSRFADSYRRGFGELPSQTLVRAPAARPAVARRRATAAVA